MAASLESMLTGGHPNSLGRTLEVVDQVLNDRRKFERLFNCYFSDDEIVRLRTSNAVKRVTIEHPEWVAPYLDRLLTEIAQIDQASTQWTLALLFDLLRDYLSDEQYDKAAEIMKTNLASHHDWIVLNNSIKTLAKWSKKDEDLKTWLIPRLKLLEQDERKSVAGNAKKSLKALQPS